MPRLSATATLLRRRSPASVTSNKGIARCSTLDRIRASLSFIYICTCWEGEGFPGRRDKPLAGRPFQLQENPPRRHEDTEKIGPSDHRIIGPSERPLVFRSPDHPISRSPDAPCLRASVGFGFWLMA